MRGRWVHEGTADGGGWNGDGERRSGEMDGSSQPSQLWTGRHGINDTEITPMLTMVDVVLVGVYIYIGAFLLWPLGATKQSHQVGAHSLKSCTKNLRLKFELLSESDIRNITFLHHTSLFCQMHVYKSLESCTETSYFTECIIGS